MGSIGRGGWCWRRGMGWKDEGGMMKDEFGYIHGEDFTGELVHVLKEKEVRLYGEIARQDWCWRRGIGCRQRI